MGRTRRERAETVEENDAQNAGGADSDIIKAYLGR